jgi:hypothetical protein
VRFKKGLYRVLDAQRDLVCRISSFSRVFQADLHILLVLLNIFW